MKKNILIGIFGLVLVIATLHSCQNSNENDNSTTSNHPGLELMITNCYSCHTPKKGMKERIAPPMIAVKKHYLDDRNISKEIFVQEIVDFLANPMIENAKMPGAIEKFNLMPNMSYPEDDIRLIAEYLYNHEIESPKWFKKHYNEEHQKHKGKEEKSNVKRGFKYALSTKAQLGKNLMGAIKSKGTKHAVEFCNTRAIPLTDSMAKFHQVVIRRVSDQPRNADNQANNEELKHIQTFKTLLANNEETKPIVVENGGDVYFYAPIKTNDMCLQCHGEKGKDIEKSVLDIIQSKYPDDKATGYKGNQIRGIWSIKMQNTSNNK